MDSAVKVAKFTMQYTPGDKGLLEHSSAACFTVEAGNIHLYSGFWKNAIFLGMDQITSKNCIKSS